MLFDRQMVFRHEADDVWKWDILDSARSNAWLPCIEGERAGIFVCLHNNDRIRVLCIQCIRYFWADLSLSKAEEFGGS